MKKNDVIKQAFDLYAKEQNAELPNEKDIDLEFSKNIIDETAVEKQTAKKRFTWTARRKILLAACVSFALIIAVIPTLINLTANTDVVYSAIYPKDISYYNYDALRENFVTNPVSAEFKKSVNKFSYETASQLLSADKNQNYSPITTYIALSLLAEGADGATKTELNKLLNIEGENDDYLSGELGNLYRSMYLKSEFTDLKMANSVWLDEQTNFKKKYIDKVKDNYYASLFNTDFSSEKTAKDMSKWVSENTNYILNPEIQLSKETVFAILSTITYEDMWVDEFNSDNNTQGDFNLDDGTKVQATYMNRKMNSTFYDEELYSRVGLGLKSGSEFSVILPKENSSVSEILSSPTLLEEVINGGEIKSGKVTLQLPKFSFDASYDLKDAISNLGAGSIFNQKTANFSKISDEKLFVGGITQDSHVEIDEKGIKSAAFVKILMVGSAMPEDNLELILDRPFIYVVKRHGVPLFIGVVANPTMK
ncbi:MAG: serpin family protein [Clostridia bacterium]